jgi:hypothetical protein
MLAKSDPADKLYDRLMQMQERAFEAGRFQVSYHLLAAAVHAAEELRRAELLDENSALFATLATTANATRARIAADAAVGRVRNRSQETN